MPPSCSYSESRQIAVAAMLQIEPLQREGEEGQGVLGAAGLDIGQQGRGQRRLDLERPRRVGEPRRPGPRSPSGRRPGATAAG